MILDDQSNNNTIQEVKSPIGQMQIQDVHTMKDLRNRIISESPTSQDLKDTSTKTFPINDVQQKLRKTTRMGTRAIDQKSLQIIENEYFQQDIEENIALRDELITPENFIQIRDHEVQFQWKIFTEVLVIHVFFYVILGPFSIPIFMKKPGMFLLRNFAFVGNQFYFYFQNFLYFFNIFSIITYFTSSSSNLYLAEIIYLFLTMFLRCFVISCKYSTLHPDKYQLYKTHQLTNTITGMDFFFRHWSVQDDFIIYREGSQSLMRAEVDLSLFYVSFFQEPSNKTKELLYRFNDDIQKEHQIKSTAYQYTSLNKLQNQEMFYGFGVFKHMVQSFKLTNGLGRFSLYATIIAMLRSFVPIIFRVVTGQIIDNSALDVVQMFGIVFNTLTGYWSCYLFLIFYIRDLSRQYFMQKQCLFLISPTQKYYKGQKQHLPSINFFNPMSLQGWSILRRMGMDYGKRFSVRLEVFMTTIVLVNTISIIIVVLWFFSIYELSAVYLVIAGYEIVSVTIIFFIILIKGALINELHEKFDNILTEHEVLCNTLRSLKDEYFLDESIPSNYIRISAIEKIKSMLNIQNQKQYDSIEDALDQIQRATIDAEEEKQVEIKPLGNFLEELIINLGDLKKELNQDNKNFSYTFLGFKITLTHVSSLFISLVTLLSVSIQYYVISKGNLKN